MASIQPDGLVNSNGVILTVGVVSVANRFAITMPIVCDTPLDDDQLCSNAVLSYIDAPIELLAACLSEDSFITFVQAEGAVDGKVPFRRDFLSTEHPGAASGNPTATQVAALAIFYSDPADLEDGEKIRCGKTFVSGISEDELAGDHISGDLPLNMTTFALNLLNGFNNVEGSGKFYRVCSLPARTPENEPVTRAISQAVRGYVATQRRRILPHT